MKDSTPFINQRLWKLMKTGSYGIFHLELLKYSAIILYAHSVIENV